MPAWQFNGNDVYYDAGNVGIGTSSPGVPLDVAGAAVVARLGINSGDPGANVMLLVRTSADHQFLVWNNGGNLEVSGYNDAHNAYVPLNLTGGPLNLAAAGSGNPLNLFAGGALRVRIGEDGNVGIGTTGPTEKLVVAGGGLRIGGQAANFNLGSAGLNLDHSPGAGNIARIYTVPGTGGSSYELSLGAGATEAIRIKTNGNVGIGTTNPGAKLEVVGKVLANVTDPTAYQFLNAGKTEGFLIDTTNKVVRPVTDNAYSLGAGAQRWSSLRVGTGDSSFAGKLGIGATTPAEKLQIAGGDILLDNGYAVKIKAADATVLRVLSVNTNDDLNVGGGYGSTGLTVDAEGTLKTNGNLQIRRNGPDIIPLIYLGRTDDQSNVPAHTNYLFWQSRTNPDGWYWGGWNTFRHPATVTGGSSAPVANGYGYYPFRNLAKNYLVEADGQIVTNLSFVGPVLYLQNPKQVDIVLPDSDTALTPTGFDSDHHPYIGLGASSAMQSPYPGQGSTTVTIASAAGLNVNDYVVLSNADASINDALRITGISGNTLTLASGTKAYPSGGNVTGLGTLSFNMASPYPTLNGTSVTVSATPTGVNPKDEVLLSNADGTVSEINQVASISGTTITLMRGTKAYSADTVKKVRELGRVKANLSDLGVKVIRDNNAMVFYDGDVTGGKHLGKIVVADSDNLKMASGMIGLQHISANSDFSFSNALFSLPSGLFSSAPRILLTARNSDNSGEGNSWQITLAAWGVTSSQFGIMGRNNRGETADFYVQWTAIGT